MESLNQTMPVKKDDLSLLEIKEEKKVAAVDSQSKGGLVDTSTTQHE